MNKILIVALATTLVLGGQTSYASEDLVTEPITTVIEDSIAEVPEETPVEKSVDLVNDLELTASPETNETVVPEETAPEVAETTVSSGVIINEVQSKGLNDAKDYVELKNTTDKDISLKGWYIEDSEPGKHSTVILDDITIPANGYLVLTEKTHFNFGLGKNDRVTLYNADKKVVDEFIWTSHTEGKVWARNAAGTFEITDPTPGVANDAAFSQPEQPTDPKIEEPEKTTNTPAEKSAITEVVINEVESDPAGGDKDYVEIYNKSDVAIDISGWYILDNDVKHKKDPKFQVKEGTILQPKTFFVFETGVDFDFGLSGNDEVNLIDKDDKLVDKYSWSNHASGTYGRVPDGTGDFVDGEPSKGRANITKEEKVIDVATKVWPGSQDVTILDETPIFDLKDLSGLDNHEGWLYGVNNKEGRFIIFRLVDGKVEFAPGFDAKGKATNFKYDANNPTKLGPDSEGITVDDKGRVYLAVERDNNDKNVNKNMILQIENPFQDKKVLVADREWDITKKLPDVGANLGIETIEWVSMRSVNGLLYDQKKNKALDANDYKNAYAEGIFFVGMEANGNIYALVLNENGESEVISEIPTGLGGVMGMDFDRANKILWAQADDGYDNILTLIQFNGTNNPTKIHISAPANMSKKLNNEGFVIDPATGKDGYRSTYWFMDGENTGAFREGKLNPNYMDELGLSEIPAVDIPVENTTETKPTNPGIPKFPFPSERPTTLPTITVGGNQTKLTAVTTPAASISTYTVYIKRGYKYFKEGTYQRQTLLKKRASLKAAVMENKTQVEAARFLLTHTPKTVARVKPQLQSLMKKSENLQRKAEAALAEIETILR